MVAIAILDDYQNVALRSADWSRLKDRHRITVLERPLASEAEAAGALKGFDVLAIMRERTAITAGLVAQLPMLRLVVTSGMQNAAVDLAACSARNITVCGTESPGHGTAELTMGLVLALARNIPYEYLGMLEGRWQTTVGMDLKGRTMGLLGLGRVGTLVASYARVFGMKVVAWSENLTPQKAYEAGAERVDKAELFRRADVVSIHTRLSDRTRGIVGAAELALMKPTALLVNTSRGPIADEAALLAALESGRLGGAGIDVYDREPLPVGHPLRRAPRCVLTPHLGYVTEDTYRVFYGGMVENIEAWLAGKPIRVIAAK